MVAILIWSVVATWTQACLICCWITNLWIIATDFTNPTLSFTKLLPVLLSFYLLVLHMTHIEQFLSRSNTNLLLSYEQPLVLPQFSHL
ncbi:MAG: hypothetical protein A3H27_09390 [Acidobacteria bacterium RIFCSPLOWO2_02_FULL_59_13]|nr:MAG: hypothetical protein A3H27_09390 [Acidobacteria bacterium RIFCSPLOWO2_02_FULL_59_13]